MAIRALSEYAIQESGGTQNAHMSSVKRCQRSSLAHRRSGKEELLHGLLIGIGARQHILDGVQRQAGIGQSRAWRRRYRIRALVPYQRGHINVALAVVDKRLLGAAYGRAGH